MFWSIYSSTYVKFLTQMHLLFIIKICFTIKVNSVYSTGHGICVTSSILRVLLSGFWVSESQFPSPRDLFPDSWVSGSQSPRVPGSRVHGLRDSASWVSGSQGLRVPGPGSLVLNLDYAIFKGLGEMRIQINACCASITLLLWKTDPKIRYL